MNLIKNILTLLFATATEPRQSGTIGCILAMTFAAVIAAICSVAAIAHLYCNITDCHTTLQASTPAPTLQELMAASSENHDDEDIDPDALTQLQSCKE